MTSGSLGLALLWVLALATHCSARMRNYLPLSEVPSHEVIHITATRHASPGPAFNRLSARERLSAMAGHPSEEELHPTFRLLSFTALGKQFDLELVKSHELLAPSYSEYSVSETGAEVYRTREQVTNCFYQGRVRALGERSESNWVTVSTCNGVQGYISGYGQLYRINPAAYHEMSYEHAEHHGEVTLESPHVILLAKHEVDFSQFPKTTHCGVDHTHEDGQHDHDHDHDNNHDHATLAQATPGPRQSPRDEVRQAFTSLHSAGASKEELSAINWNAYVAPPAANVDVCSKLPNTQDSTLPRTLRAPFVPTNTAGPIFPGLAIANDRPRVGLFGTFRLTGENAIGLVNLANTYYANSPDFTQTPVKLSIVIQYFFTVDSIPTTPVGSEINYNNYLTNAATYFNGNTLGASQVAGVTFTIGTVLSGFDFQASVVGLASTDGACKGTKPNYEGIDIVQTTFCDAFNAATLAHEIGHNLGMCHDTELDSNGACSNAPRVPPAVSTSCPYYPANTNTDCTGSTSCLKKVMAAASNPDDPYVTFSHCSASDLLGAMSAASPGKECLKPQLTAASTCGNGYVDGDEECDCGLDAFNVLTCTASTLPAAYQDPCCNGLLCRLLPGKNCSAYQPCCDPNTCKPRTDTSVVCRAVKTCIKCDAEEKCDGVNANCPADILDPDCNGKSAILKWLEDHWIPLVFGILGGLALFFIVGCVRRKCCTSDKAKPAAQRQSVAAGSRASQAQQQQSVPMSARGQSQSQPRPPPMNPAATGVVLPPNWVVQYTENGQPVYINTITGERYDFAQQQSGGF